MEPTTALFVKNLGTQKRMPSWLKEIQKDYRYISWGHFPGCIDLSLDEYLVNEDRIFIYLKILEEIKKELIGRGELISKEELNSYTEDEAQRVWGEDLETERIIKVLNFIKDLIDGRLIIKASDPIDYFF